MRFGCCTAAAAPGLVERLLCEGATTLPDGHRLRLVAFGSTVESGGGGAYQRVSLGHVLRVPFTRAELGSPDKA